MEKVIHNFTDADTYCTETMYWDHTVHILYRNRNNSSSVTMCKINTHTHTHTHTVQTDSEDEEIQIQNSNSVHVQFKNTLIIPQGAILLWS